METTTSAFNTNDKLGGSPHPELEDHVCENDKLSVDSEAVWELLLQLDA